MEDIVNRLLRLCALATFLASASSAFAAFHLFRIEQIYSNADGTVQFIVLRESAGVNGENFWQNQALTSTHLGVANPVTFPSNLPSASTAGKRVLVATPGFAALGLVTPDYMIPNGFLATDGGTVNYAGVDQVTYTALPTDGVHAIDRTGATIQNVATNFAGKAGSVVLASTPINPVVGLWWNPDESGSGYNFDVKHGTLVVTIFTYDASGHSEWYLAAGPLATNGATTTFSATLDKYRNGQCVGVGCTYRNPGPPAGNDGILSITFTSSTSATLTLPGRVTNIQPQVF
jgi:hypothetical protein